jgi:hypothetical protein
MSNKLIQIACFAFWHSGASEKARGRPPMSVACRVGDRSFGLNLSENRYESDPKLDRFVRVTISEFVRYIESALFLGKESDTFVGSIFCRVWKEPNAFVESESMSETVSGDCPSSESLPEDGKPASYSTSTTGLIRALRTRLSRAEPSAENARRVPRTEDKGNRAADTEPKKPRDVSGDRASAVNETTPKSKPASPPKTDRPVSPVPKRPDSDTRKKVKPVSNATKPKKVQRVAAEREKQDGRTEAHKNVVPNDTSAVAPIGKVSPPPAPVEKSEPLPDFPEIRTPSPEYERVRGSINALRDVTRTVLSGGSEDAHGLIERLWDIFESLQSGKIIPPHDRADVSSGALAEAWATLGHLERLLYEEEADLRQAGIVALTVDERRELTQKIVDIVSILHPDIELG